MKVLIFDFGAYTMPDIMTEFQKEQIQYRLVSYHFENKNEDAFFCHRFQTFLKEDRYDAVFSVNYFPLVAECCRNNKIKYLSWSYDNPLNVLRIEETLGYETNYVFLYDRIQAEKYQKKGYRNVFHLPLAVNTDRLDQIRLNRQEQEQYRTQIAFVGKLYESPLGEYLNLMDDFMKGYMQSLCDIQRRLYGAYLVDELLTDQKMERIQAHFQKLKKNTSFVLPKDALSYGIAAEITREERILLLNLLSNHFGCKLYTRDDCSMLPKVTFMGSCGYQNEMPKIFKASDLNLNISLKCIQSGMSLRMLDIMGAGGCLFSNYQIELAENFVDGEDVIMYESIEDAYEKAAFYLKHAELRRAIAEKGYGKVKEYFNYQVQLQKLFSLAGGIQ